MRVRAQAIVIRNNKVLFIEEQIGSKRFHCFPGGKVELGESQADAALRELSEEAGVEGKIIFLIPEPVDTNHFTFLIKIDDGAVCALGINERDADDDRMKGIIWLDITESPETFTSVDKESFKRLVDECKIRNYDKTWLPNMINLIN